MMEETLVGSCSYAKTRGACRSVEYVVSEPGPFFRRDLVPDSHQATVTFTSTTNGRGQDLCTMTWKVTFETLRFQSLYQAFSLFTIVTAARTVAEAVCLPQMLTLQTTLVMTNNASSDKPWIEARREWLELLWDRVEGCHYRRLFRLGTFCQKEQEKLERAY
ncbi:hypothetical protein IV203_021942 [Nitzschia inconspicua]|uniref:Uncharacterized protein n=1 Tax=Nitzschia inconspicua TaxID=303405 RepID=A0A9K3PGD6_9STRA|nr:hypothetical protein IV203_021942 [Nitzschia inconspicua]